jgi:hypothetical protein
MMSTPVNAAKILLRRQWIFLVLLSAIALAAGVARWNAQKHHYYMMDEQIAEAVVSHVLSTGTLDTNWARTDVLPDFRYDQYNFSSYYLSAAIAVRIAGALGFPTADDQLLSRLRNGNAVLAALAIALAGWIGLRLGGGWVGTCAAVLTSIQVSLFQDALYARPDVFASLLTLSLYLVSTTGPGSPSAGRIAVAGLVLGLMIACKITFALLVPFTLVAFALRMPHQAWLRGFIVFAATAAAGFALGAPYAVAAPSEYLHGVHYLVTQYSNGLPPLGVAGGDLSARLAHSGRYLFETVGWPSLLFTLLGAWALLRMRRDRPAMVLLLFGTLASGAYFLQSSAFVERNFSHALPFAFVLVGLGIVAVARVATTRVWIRAGLGLALLVLCAWTPWHVTQLLVRDALARPTLALLAREREKIDASGEVYIDAAHHAERVAAVATRFCSGWVIKLEMFGDVHSRDQIEALRSQGLIAEPLRFEGPFHRLQVSTLHTYHGGDLVFLRPPVPAAPGCRLALTRLPAEAVATPEPDVLQREGHAVRDGHPPEARGLPPNALVYATWDWNDAHTGTISYRGELCPGQSLPVAAGPSPASLRLRIDLADANGTLTNLHDGAFPTLAEGWTGITLRSDAGACARIELTVEDPATHWGTWVGLGAPLGTVQTLPQSSVSASSRQ